MTIYTPYTYRIAWTRLNKHYYGVRYAIDCSPADFWTEYFTSSSVVEEYRKLYGEPDVVEIRKTFTCPKKAQEWEVKVLRRLDVLHSDKWLNRAIAGVIAQDDEWRRKISVALKGKKMSDSAKRKLSESRKGMKFSVEHRANLSKASRGRPTGRKGEKLSAEVRKKLSESHKGQIPWNKGRPHSEETRRKLVAARRARISKR